ncbi:MAG TPA: 2OG-Fe(II) oxygenase [Sphingomonadaceae bacterium]
MKTGDYDILANAPDKGPLARLGIVVRTRLAANPKVYKVPVDKAEIFVVGEFLSPAECVQLREMIDAVARPSPAYLDAEGKTGRTSYTGDVDPHDPFVLKIQRRIDDLLGIPGEYGETIQGQRYSAGQQFPSHFDWFRTDAAYWPEQQKGGGQRSWTTMVFLNEVEEGGKTEFPALGVAIEPTPGALLAWNNATPEGYSNEWTMHAGTPVTKGIKYIITRWYRTRRWAAE